MKMLQLLLAVVVVAGAPVGHVPLGVKEIPFGPMKGQECEEELVISFDGSRLCLKTVSNSGGNLTLTKDSRLLS